MFGFLKRKTVEIKSPIDGMIVTLDSVDDEVFSTKMVGDGVAIIPTGTMFTAPIDGVVNKIFPTLHAYSIKNKDGLEVMVHIGLDTVSLGGKGFQKELNEGDDVKAGDNIISIDLEYLKSHAKNIVTPIVILDSSPIKSIKSRVTTVKSQDTIMEVK